jgi:tether containing UBX domain for GLUT4
VQPNTKILEVLEEVCKKQGLNPNEYELVHHKKVVDIAYSVRLSGVPNNAQLELRKSESGPRQYENVTVLLQLDDGTRLEPLTFKPDVTSLLNLVEAYMNLESTAARCDYMKAVLDDLTATRSGMYPTFSYLNEQIIGLYQIKNTTLKDMGLTHGRVIVRFSFRNIESEPMAKMNEEFRAKIQKNAKLDEIFQSKLQSQREEEERRARDTPAIAVEPAVDMSNSMVSLTESMVQEAAKTINQPPPQATNSEPQRPPRAIDRLNHPQQQQQHQPRQQQQQNQLDLEYEFISKNNRPNNEFLNFKFPEATKGQALNNVNELADIERESKSPCERKAIIIHAEREESASSTTATMQASSSTVTVDDEHMDDDFYKVTVDDLKVMLKDLKKHQSEDAPLMTRQIRELEQDKKAMRYTQVVIRVVFPNRQTLQGLFRPKESVSALYAFVRESLAASTDGANSPEDLDFYLFTTLPKIVLSCEAKKTLFEAQLCPAALIYFKNKSEQMPKFRDELLSEIKTPEEADEIVRQDVHGKIRDVERYEGMNLLHKEQVLTANLLKNSGLVSSHTNNPTTSRAAASSDDSSQRQRDREPVSDVNKKLERFLKGSKK